MAAGVVLNGICIAVALSGVELERFLIALFTLGVGWNFLFIGGTSLVTTAYRPEEKTRAQAAMDTTIFTTMTITSFSSGALVTTQGWTWLNLGSIVPVVAIAIALAWYRCAAARRPGGAPGLGFGAAARRAGDEIEAEQAALDRPVPHRHAARFLQAHRARQRMSGLRIQAVQPAGCAV